MIRILQRYKLVFIGIMLIILASVLWLGYNRLNSRKIPTKGVFVMQDHKNLLFPIPAVLNNSILCEENKK